MYDINIARNRDTANIIHSFALLAAAATLTATYNSPEESNIPTFENFQIQSSTVAYSSDTALDDNSFYKSMTSSKVSSVENIVKKMITQIDQLNFLELDDNIDREIDSYFAENPIKINRKILFKRV